MSSSDDDNPLVNLIVLIVVVVLIYEFIAGFFIRKKCESESLKTTVEMVTQKKHPDYEKRSYIQEEMYEYLYKDCLNSWWLWEFDLFK